MYGESSVCKKHLPYALGWCRKERQKKCPVSGISGKSWQSWVGIVQYK